jgi:hypothetical protein
MKKTLRRVLERLRAVTDGMHRKRASVRSGLGEPQRMQPLPVRVRAPSGR